MLIGLVKVIRKRGFTLVLAVVSVLVLVVLGQYFSGRPDHDKYAVGARNPDRTFDGSRPPLPNFHNPVDYVEWSNEYLAKGKDPESARIYDGFWRYGGDEKCMPDPNEYVNHQLLALAAGPQWATGRYPQVESYLRAASEYIKVFEQATSQPEYCLQVNADPDMPNSMAVLPWTISGKYALCALMAVACEGAENKEQAKLMFSAWEKGLKHASHLRYSRCLLLVQESSDVRMTVYRAARAALRHGVIERKSYRKAYDVLLSADPGSFTLTDSIYVQWGWSLGVLQSLHPRGRLDKNIAAQFIDVRSGPLQLDKLTRTKVNPYILAEALDKYCVNLLHLSRQPLSIELLENVREFQDEQRSGRFGDHPLWTIVFPRVDHAFLLELRALTSLRATLVILLVHEYYSEHGTWPESLAEIKLPDGCQSLVDPFSQQLFVYKVGAQSFLLYSVGEDKTDNQGKHKAWNRWGKTEGGTDFVFWPIQQ
jgi:hypothetical protein